MVILPMGSSYTSSRPFLAIQSASLRAFNRKYPPFLEECLANARD
jgi:hypothetical protein